MPIYDISTIAAPSFNRRVFFPSGQLRPISKGCGPAGFPCPPTSPGLGSIAGGGGLGRLLGEVEAEPSYFAQHPTAATAYMVAGLAGTGLGAYHGYKRNGGSVGWAIVWGLLGGWFPIITIPVALAQGFGKRG